MSRKRFDLLQHKADTGENAQSDTFISEAQAALEQARASGLGYEANEVHAYIRARIGGKPAQRPAARKWRV